MFFRYNAGSENIADVTQKSSGTDLIDRVRFKVAKSCNLGRHLTQDKGTMKVDTDPLAIKLAGLSQFAPQHAQCLDGFDTQDFKKLDEVGMTVRGYELLTQGKLMDKVR